MDDPQFRGLVEYVRRNYIAHRSDLWQDAAKSWAHSYACLPERARPAMLSELIERSRHAKLDWDAVSLIAQEALRGAAPLPMDLAEWVADVLAGVRTRPRRSPQTTSARDRMFSLAVDDLRNRFGLSPTRNETSPAQSACDVVATAGGFAYKTVERAWTNRDPILS